MGSSRRRFDFDADFDDTEEEKAFVYKGKTSCRACSDFKSWRQQNNQQKSSNTKDVNNAAQQESSSSNEAACPLDVEELGRNTWSFLHTMAAYYPEKPSDTQKKDMTQFISLFSKFYPCDICAGDFQESLKESQPDVSNSSTLSNWFCEQHNIVNRKLGKEEFDCSKVFERWKDGWKDGSCD